MALEALSCKECGPDYPLEARYVCEQLLRAARGRLRPLGPRRRRGASARSRRARPASGATPTSCRSTSGPRDPLEPGLTPLVRADRLAERLGLGELWIKNDAANPTHSFKDRVVAVGAGEGARARLRDRRLRLDRQPRQRRRRARRGRRARLVRVRARRPRGAEAARDRRLRHARWSASSGNYDDVNRLCTELCRDPAWAFVNVNLRPYYAEGSKTLAYETVEQLGWKLPDRVVCPIASGSLFTKLGRGLRGVARPRPRRGRAADLQRRPGRGLQPGRRGLRRGPRRLPPARPDTIAKSLAIGNPADGPYALDLARRTGGVDRVGHRRRDPRRHQAARRDDRHLHRDRRRRDDRGAREAGRARARSTPASGSSSTSPARASRRSTRPARASRSRDRADARRRSRPSRRAEAVSPLEVPGRWRSP